MAFFSYFAGNAMLDQLRVPRRARLGVFSVAVAALACKDFRSNLEYLRDWHKQEALVRAFRADDEIRGHTTFLVRDDARALDAKDRDYRVYEWCGLMREAFGDQIRYATTTPLGMQEQLHKRQGLGISTVTSLGRFNA